MKNLLILVLILSLDLQVFAWARRGHSMIASRAAYLVAQNSRYDFMKTHSYDLGYYNNCPDFVWKSIDSVYKTEAPEHYTDLEAFKDVKAADWNEKWARDRNKFFEKYKVENKHGRALWRIHELVTGLEKLTEDLRQPKLEKERRRSLQGRWIVQAGLLGHYVADLSMPLHTTENHDGQATNQRGVHAWYEQNSVDEIYPDIEQDVKKRAEELWKEFSKNNKDKDAFAMSYDLAIWAHSKIDELLKIDKELGRKDVVKAAEKFRPIIVEGMARSAVVLAEIWTRNLGFDFDDEKFYFFETAPEYRYPYGVMP